MMDENDGERLTRAERTAWHHLSGDAEQHAGHRVLLVMLLVVIALELGVLWWLW